MRRTFVLSLTLLLALALAGPSGAVVNGEPDGDGHPNVGALVAEWPRLGEKEILCSGTLIDEDLFLTAGHCTGFLESQGIEDVWVTFDPTTSNTLEQPIDEAETTLIPGSYVTHPDFSAPGGGSDPHDIAVVLLDGPAAAAYPGIEPASLPTLNQFSSPRELRGQRFTAVGYGFREAILGGGPPFFPFDGDRWRAVSSFRSVENTWLHLSQNRSTGDGGTCFGDSGGPNFLGEFGVDETDVIAAITVKGDAMCRASSVTYRLDTRSARDFLGGFVALP